MTNIMTEKEIDKLSGEYADKIAPNQNTFEAGKLWGEAYLKAKDVLTKLAEKYVAINKAKVIAKYLWFKKLEKDQTGKDELAAHNGFGGQLSLEEIFGEEMFKDLETI